MSPEMTFNPIKYFREHSLTTQRHSASVSVHIIHPSIAHMQTLAYTHNKKKIDFAHND